MNTKTSLPLLGSILSCLGLTAIHAPGDTFSVVGSFPSSQSPAIRSPLVAGSDGALYGTASEGGTYGQGSVFRINPDGSGLTNLYTFFAGKGPYHPYGGLILSGDTLYGTLSDGGNSFAGALFKINTNGGGFTNFFTFGFSNGSNPYGRLLLSGNTLYGTTQFGGSGSFGSVFKIDTDGSNFKTLRNFSNDGNGRDPQAGLVISGSVLYGTTFYGGVFQVDTNGDNFAVVKNVTGNTYCDLVLQNGTLYGTTQTGGDHGYGSVFSVGTDGNNFTNLYSFSGTDGQTSVAGLVLVGDTLYGTTEFGGTSSQGVVFKINTDGTGFEDVYNFTAGDDGGTPQAGLILFGDTLYGTTEYHGVIYKLELSGPALTCQASPGSLNISWPSSATGFTLQQSSDLSTSSWSDFTGNVSDNGTSKSVSVDTSSGLGFYKLTSP